MPVYNIIHTCTSIPSSITTAAVAIRCDVYYYGHNNSIHRYLRVEDVRLQMIYNVCKKKIKYSLLVVYLRVYDDAYIRYITLLLRVRF